jgi:DNA-directed RNA polymerase alpha subunit
VVTTDDIIPEMGWENQAVLPVSYPIDGVETPISILTLEKGQSIKFRASAKLGIGKNHAKWSPVSIATYQLSKDENEFDFKVETLGGITPVDILKTAIQVLKTKVQGLVP